MNIKNKVILCISSTNKITKKKLAEIYGINEDAVKSSVRWFNELFGNRITYDNNGYYFISTITNDEYNYLINNSKTDLFIDIVYNLLCKSLQSDLKISQQIEYDNMIFYEQTIDTFLNFIGLKPLKQLVSDTKQNKIYYLSIFPLYFPQEDGTLSIRTIKSIEENFNANYEFTCNYIHEHLMRLYGKLNSNVISTHTHLCFHTAYVISYLLSEKKTLESYVTEIFEYEFVLPNYLDEQLFNTILILESDFTSENFNFKSSSSLKNIYNIYVNIDYLKLDHGYITPKLCNFPYLNPYIYYELNAMNIKEYHISKYISKRLIIKLISSWVENNVYIQNFSILNYNNEYNEKKLLYKSDYSDRIIYILNGNKNCMYNFKGSTLFIFDSVKKFKELCDYSFSSGLKTLTLKNFEVRILLSVPISFISDIITTLKINFPNIKIIFINFLDISSQPQKCTDIYNVVRGTNYPNLPSIKNDKNFSLNEFNNIINKNTPY